MIKNEIVFYETEDGKISIAVRFEQENIWLTQKQIAELLVVPSIMFLYILKIYIYERELSFKVNLRESRIIRKRRK